MSKVMFALIIIMIFMAGALFSYIWVVGYYFSLELKVPEKPTVSICSFEASADNPTFFNITVLNPTFAPRAAEILGISVLAGENKAYRVLSTEPPIPSGGYRLELGSSKTFKCFWTWANYTGQSISVMVHVKDGSGAVFTATLPLVAVEIERLEFDPNHGERFGVSIRNGEKSTISVDLKSIKVIVDGSEYEVKSRPTLPFKLDPNVSLSLTCEWNWATHQGRNVTVIVGTSQGYIGKRASLIPIYAVFNVSQIAFNPNNTSFFSITVVNSPKSLIALNVTEAIIRLENGSIIKPSKIIPELPYILEVGSEITFICEWNWAPYSGREITIIINTGQGYNSSLRYVIPLLPE
ncbi:MAG: hypothetical protein QW702_06700 [Candidatus Bathyarchaeia archaeon]